MRIALIGASGHIGREIAREALRRGHTVTAITRSPGALAAELPGIAVKTAVFPFSVLGKAMAAGETDGFVKWVADPVTGQLLGAQAIGCHATELISEATLAIRNELTIDEVGNAIHCHPTLSEAWMEAAHAFHGACIHLPKR